MSWSASPWAWLGVFASYCFFSSKMFHIRLLEWDYPAHLEGLLCVPALWSLSQHVSDLPTWQMLSIPLLFGVFIPGSSSSGYKKPLFACTKAILCNFQMQLFEQLFQYDLS